MIHHFKTAFISEHLKKKGTGIYTLGLIIGVLSPLILFISRLNGSMRHIPRNPHNIYVNYIENALELFAYYMLPFLIILVASRITQLDHKNKGWRLMEGLPIKKYGVYFSKFSIVLITNIIAITSFVILSVVFVYVLTLLGKVPGMGLLEIPYSFCVKLILRLVVASLFLSSLQFVLSALITNFLWPIFIGIIGFSLSTVFNEGHFFLSWFPYTPISITHRFPHGSEVGNVLIYLDYMSLIASVIILYIGYNWFKKKRFIALFSVKDKMLIQTLSVILIFGFLFIYVQKSKQFLPHNRTVLKGKIVGDVSPKNVSVIDSHSKDTLFYGSIKNNEFDIVFTDSLAPKMYEIILDKHYKTKVFFGAYDSIDVRFAIKNNKRAAKVYGTRLGENDINSGKNVGMRLGNDFLIRMMIEDSTYYKRTGLFLKRLERNWETLMAEIENYTTIDNYTIRNDFRALQKSQITKKYRKYFNDFRAAASEKNPDLILDLPKKLAHLKEPKIPIEHAIDDLSEFEMILDRKASYSQLSNFDYNKAISNLKKKMRNSKNNTVTIPEFVNEMAKIMAEIGDRHASVRDIEYTYNLQLPFGIVPYEGKFLALKKRPNTYDYQYLHKRFPYIKSINGVAIETFMDKYSYKHKKAPEASKLNHGAADIQKFEKLFFNNNMPCPERAKVVFTDGKNDTEETFKLVTEKMGFTSKLLLQNYYNSKYMRKKQFGELHRILNSNIGYITLPSMQGYKDNSELEDYIETTIERFSNTKALIIDVRNNPGGRREILQTIANYIIQPEQSPWVANVAYLRTNIAIETDESSMNNRFLYAYNSEKLSDNDRKAIDTFNKNFKTERTFEASKFSNPFYMVLHNGKTPYTKPAYILANERSFSAASIFASAFKGLPNVKIVGVTTDGSSGNSREFYLKNSDIKVKVSTMLSFQRNGKTLDGNGTEPDIYIPVDLEQIFTGKDTQLEKLVGIINKRINSVSVSL